MNLLYNHACPRKLLIPFTEDGGIVSIFALSTSIPLAEILGPSIIPFFIMKWHFT